MHTSFGRIAIVLLALGLVSGCNRHVDSLDPVRELPTPLEAPFGLSVTIGNQSATLSWEMTNVSGVAYYRIYSADSIDGEFVVRDTSAAPSRTLSNLLYNREYFFKVAAVRTGGAEGLRSTAVSVRIPAVAIVINDNQEFTRSRSVRVGLNAGSGASEFQISEDSVFASAPIQNFATSAQFELSEGDGTKRVYARFYYNDGSRTSFAIFDAITLDTRAQITAFTFAPTTTMQTGDVITFTLTAGESKGNATATFAGAPDINLYDDGLSPDATAGDGVYTGRWTIPVGVAASSAEVDGKFTDAAGNSAILAKAPVLLTIHPTPQAVSIVSTVALSTYQIEVIWSQATASNFMSYRLYRAATANVTTSSELLATLPSRSTVLYTDTALNADTKYFYRVYVVDSFGVSAGSNVDSARTLVNTAPVPVTLAGTLSTDSSTFKLSWTQSGEVDFASYRLYRKASPGVTTADQLVAIINSAGTDTINDFVSGPATVYYKIFVFDRHGLSAGSNEIQLTK
ncbi:MAG: fibronectin type III domain-containing protein [candidate division Zixibacteria bacterium]|nr:fibronectin type III domain-containing protein [candidate division Zixibacteria bacterium]